ncbi:hypothetical protein LZ554_008323 [Drepanopeziza brunnea f. sp. 'monogermtubi']|nr:hypothetical protein LZ554_008323 [Drepanopeziza brunnea f. sp. 'monogermtubi']
MRSILSLSAGVAAVFLLTCNTVRAHTWVEEVRKIASSGAFVGDPGYIRNFGPRLPGVSPDIPNVHLLPPNGNGRSNAILPTDLMCKSNQLKGQQTEGFPVLSAAPQDQIALRYHENGHVTLFATNPGKPAGRGTVFVYGTSQSLDSDTYLGIHRVWNPDGTGGDKRGKLLATRPYDDGRCFQNNANSKVRAASVGNFPESAGDLLCQTDVQLPADAPTSGSYTLYWVWEWPTLDASGNIATNESYTSCMDISMTSNTVAAAGAFDSKAINGLAANSAAIKAQMLHAFLVDPNAAPQITPDNVPGPAPTTAPPIQPKTEFDVPNIAVPVAAPAPAPSNKPAAGVDAALPPTSSKPNISVPTPKGAFITVTVTGAKQMVTVTVTKEVAVATSAISTSLQTQSTAETVTTTISRNPTSSASALPSSAFSSFSAMPMASAYASGVPKPAPFLSPDSQVRPGTFQKRAEAAPQPELKRTLRFHPRS